MTSNNFFGWAMQILPNNPVLQSLSGAQETGAVRQNATAARTETAKAVTAAARSEAGKHTETHARREPEDDDNTSPKPRGSIVDVVI
jgi:hypothetical protein